MVASYAQRAGSILKAAGLAPKKSWGQHFLRDESVLRHIVGHAGVAQGGTVVELGAGLGALTLALLDQGLHVVAVERDRELVPLLGALTQEPLPPGAKLTLREADAARLDYTELAAAHGAPLHVLGNLPYQLSGRILVSLAEAADVVAGAVVLVQREVGERLAAGPGSRAYGLLSVLVQRRFDVRLTREVPPGAFLPPPKVHSAVLTLTRVDNPTWRDVAPDVQPALLEAALVRVARAAFATRRKTLGNALSMGLALDKATALRVLEHAGVDPIARAETLDLTAFARIANSYLALVPQPQTRT